jgi:hypothetical protein
MHNPGSATFLILFGVSTLLIYLAIRRRWLTLKVSGGVGVAANTLFLILYLLSESKEFLPAVALGVLFSLLFTGMAVALAAFFKNNAYRPKPSPEPEPADAEPPVTE